MCSLLSDADCMRLRYSIESSTCTVAAMKDLSKLNQIGQTSLAVPAICFGTSGLGNMPDTYGYEVDETRAVETIQKIFDTGNAFIDTSRNYGFGRSEQRIGTAIRERGGLPDGIVISTKLDRDMETGRFDAGRARQSFEQSLEALGVDRVHMLHLHDPEYCASLEEVTADDGPLAELFKIKSEGMADAVGLAAGRTDIMMPLLEQWSFDCLITHNRFTLINRHAEPMIDLACSRGMSVLNAAPYGSGVLAKGSTKGSTYVYQPVSETVLQPIRAFEAVCAQHEIPIGAAALQFSLRDARIASTICGITHPDRIAETQRWAQWPIADSVWEELSALGFETNDPEASREYLPG